MQSRIHHDNMVPYDDEVGVCYRKLKKLINESGWYEMVAGEGSLIHEAMMVIGKRRTSGLHPRRRQANQIRCWS